MKKLSLVLNAVLLVAVAGLYTWFILDKKSNSDTAVSSGDEMPVEISGEGIVYINIDSVLSKYDMYFDLQTELQSKLKVSEAQLASKEKTLRKEMEDFQYKIQRQLITRSDAEKQQQELAKKEQDLYQLQNNLQRQLAEEEQVAQRKVLNSIMEYLKSLEGNKKYKFVLGTTFGGNILYANKNLNITREVIEGINSSYSASKAE